MLSTPFTTTKYPSYPDTRPPFEKQNQQNQRPPWNSSNNEGFPSNRPNNAPAPFASRTWTKDQPTLREQHPPQAPRDSRDPRESRDPRDPRHRFEPRPPTPPVKRTSFEKESQLNKVNKQKENEKEVAGKNLIFNIFT